MPHRQFQLDVAKSIGPITWPMGLTFLRLLLLPVFLWLLLADVPIDQVKGPMYRHAALAVFVVMAITDKLDGYLARKFHQVSKLGAFLDPLADKLLVAASVVLLSFTSVAGPGYRIPTVVVIVIYAKDVLLSVGALVVVSRTGRVTIAPRLAGKLNAVIQLALVLATLMAGDLNRASPALVARLLPGLWWAAVVAAIIASVDYVVQGKRQYSLSHPTAGIDRKS